MINVLVIAVNDAPVAINDNFDLDENVEFDQAAPGLLDNDQDPDGEEETGELTAILVDGPTVVDHSSVPQAPGTLQLNPDGSFKYIPPSNVNGIATFTYKINDGLADSNVATVTIDIGERNIDPVARNDFTATPEDTPVEINVLANDTDANDGDQLFVIDLPTLGGAANGYVTFNANGNLTYTPFSGFAGQDTFQYTINDGSGGEDATATVTINVLATTNIPPIATDDSAVTTEDTDVTIPVLDNDLDVEDDVLTIVDFTPALRGQVVLNGDQFVYTPDPDFASTDQFTYRITDGRTIVGPATVTLFVSPVNDDPIALDDLVAAVEDTVKQFQDDDLIDNDSDVDNDTGDLEILSFTQPPNGHLTLALGVFTYTPDEGFNGDDTFNYQLWDQRGEPVEATVTITVAEAPDPPIAADDVGFTPEDTAVTIDVLANDEDPDEETLSISAIAVQPTNGTLVINGGSITYTPAADFFGLDTFDYTISDGNGPLSVDTATVTINVASVNDPPVANNDDYDALSGIQLTVTIANGLLLNDHDIENDVLKAVLVTPPTNGTLLFTDDGSFQYTPGPGFAGDDTFTYRANGGSNDSAPATVTIAVVNQVPFANNDFFSMTNTNDGTGVTFTPGVLANDNDGDAGDVLLAIYGSGPSNGALDFNQDGSFTYTPDPDFEGTDTFTYTASDGLDESDPSTVTVTVTLVPTHDPIANDDFYTVAEDTTLTVADGPGDIIDGQADGTGKDSDGDVTDTLVASLGSPPANGSFAFNASGSFTYTPNPDFNGTDTFTYTITDGVTDSNSATVTIEVTPVNDAPNAVDDTVATTQGEAVDVDVLANDEDVDSDPLIITVIGDPVNGVVELLGDNKIRYTPAPALVGEDTFTYTIVDGDPGGPATATVTVHIVGIAHAPVAVDDNDGTDEDVALNIAVTTNDTDEDGDILTPAIVTQPANGSVVVQVDLSVTYTPTLNFNGTDTFTYTVTDGFNVSDPATVTVDVAAINDLPTAVDDLAVTLQGDPVTISVLNNDTDPENDTLSIAGITQPADPGDGTVAVAGNTLVFTPAAATTGVVTLTYD
ncbi:MAG TPA: thrombospondin, partial [Lentisphaeria bacterium]|nr:thrombospondin [Lentisphaeria bacterium]